MNVAELHTVSEAASSGMKFHAVCRGRTHIVFNAYQHRATLWIRVSLLALLSILTLVERSPGEERRWSELFTLAELEAAASAGKLGAQNYLAEIYLEGKGTKKDIDAAVHWFRKAAEAGYPPAQSHLGVCYHEGTGVAEDKKRAAEWFLKAAEKGFDDAMFNIGRAYLRADGVPKSIAQGISWLKRGADAGHLDSQKLLAALFYSGAEGVTCDRNEAARWAAMGAAQDDGLSLCTLALCYFEGAGVPEDVAHGLRLLRRSAELGWKDAQRGLGGAYVEIQDAQEGYYWLRLAAAQGDLEARKKSFPSNRRSLRMRFKRSSTVLGSSSSGSRNVVGRSIFKSLQDSAVARPSSSHHTGILSPVPMWYATRRKFL